MNKNPADLENGTVVYFEIGTGTVFKGTIVGRDRLEREHAYSDYSDEDNLARVEIDFETSVSDDGLPDHVAPEEYQPDDNDGWVFRDSYTIDAEEQHYIVRPSSLVEVLETPN